ncbi:CCDC93, coiled-coil domain [Pelomyxa schiedti]|nr:CCDC93, coiled-coil domain [Pelomyxa schiedti]
MFGAGDDDKVLQARAGAQSKRVDYEAERKLAEILELFLSGGYFRARVNGISPFDKILGGLAWAISACNQDVDLDIFQENAPLGVKLRLGENIVRALVRMKCPHQLQTFQIKGLDYINIFPVVQWIIKKVMEARAQTGDIFRQFSESQFRKSFASPTDTTLKPTRKASTVFIQGIRAKNKPTRKFRRTKKVAPTPQTTLLEYGHMKTRETRRADDEESAEEGQNRSQEEEQIQEAMNSLSSIEGSGDKVGGSVAASYIQMSGDLREAATEFAKADVVTGAGQKKIEEKLVASKTAQIQKAIQLKTKQLAALKETQAAKDAELQQLQAQLIKKLRLNKRIQIEIQKLEQMETPENSAQLKKLKELIEIQETLKIQEGKFRANCKRQMQQLKDEIERARKSNYGDEEDVERMALIAETWTQASTKLMKLKQLSAKKSRDIGMTERKIDEVPSRLELTMYQRQFVELYDQVSVKLAETKRYYTTYNTLVDSIKCYTKEVEILEHIQANYTELMKTKTSREKFIESMASIIKQVTTQIEDRTAKLAAEKDHNSKLTETLKQLTEKERNFYKATREFQEECATNDKLEEELAAAAKSHATSEDS